jgi:hypothetical protein
MSSEPVAVPPAGLLLRAGKWETARDELRERLAQGPDGAAFEGLAQTFWWLDDGTRCLEAREDAYHFLSGLRPGPRGSAGGQRARL